NDSNTSNPLIEQLLINVSVTASAANYSFNADITRNGNFLTSSTNFYDLSAGEHTISIPIDARLLSNGTVNATITIQKQFLTLYREEDAVTINYNNENFVKPEIIITLGNFKKISVDADSKAEILRINGTINGSTQGIYEFRAFMKSDNISISTSNNYTLNNDIQLLSLDFNTSEIRKNRILNPNVYSIFVKNGLRYIFDTNLDITYNLTDLDPQQSLLEDTYQDGLADNNASLQINISVFALNTATYNLTVQLRDEEDNFLVEETKAFNLNAGSSVVQFNLNGTNIYNTGTNGPYTLNVLFAEDEVANAHTTASYNYDNFQAPPLPDLTLNSAEV
ncbi:MAG: hypothetical protein QF535_23550, partial [Anaerolineales bacterium]|nr:hypothetical protein [Anaerolineales bacterium]